MPNEKPWQFTADNNPNKAKWRGTNPSRRQKIMTDELSNAWTPSFAELCERLAMDNEFGYAVKRLARLSKDDLGLVNQRGYNLSPSFYILLKNTHSNESIKLIPISSSWGLASNCILLPLVTI